MAQSHNIPLAALIPFVALLGAIAVLPLTVPVFWERNRNKLGVALVLSVPAAAYLLSAHLGAELWHSIIFDYVPFIILLGSLFVIASGIVVDGDIEARPHVITAIMGLGAVLASLIGTTGAAMVLIRPLLETIQGRQFKAHTIMFFIALVCNCGGLLTPLGDPPLFMLYLRGAPFTWFLKLAPEWMFVNGALLLVYFLTDTYFWGRETKEVRTRERAQTTPITIRGKLNFIWLAGVVLAVALVNGSTIPVLHHNRGLSFAREAVILLMASLSFMLTPHSTRAANRFTWHPIQEVAYLFLGIFVTMVPCLIYLQEHALALGVTGPAAFYYATGAISSFLDNTPTAVTCHSLAEGLGQHGAIMIAGIPEGIFRAICAGAVFFGAMTYIGNGPNFMIRAMAERHGIVMPHFFQYIWRFSLTVLLPIFILAQVLFV